MNRVLAATSLAALLMTSALPAAAAPAAEQPLKIIVVDVEGGTATLMVTPQGRSVLLDAGCQL